MWLNTLMIILKLFYSCVNEQRKQRSEVLPITDSSTNLPTSDTSTAADLSQTIMSQCSQIQRLRQFRPVTPQGTTLPLLSLPGTLSTHTHTQLEGSKRNLPAGRDNVPGLSLLHCTTSRAEPHRILRQECHGMSRIPSIHATITPILKKDPRIPSP